jgi:hypothetical protein
MKLTSRSRAATKRQQGLTLIEIMVGGTISVGLAGGLLCLLAFVAKEQQRELADAILQEETSFVQDQLMRLVRSMSQSESVIFGNPTQEAGVTVFQSVIVARGQAPAYPREVIRYDPSTQALIHDPDRTVTGDQVQMCVGKGGAVLRKLYFFPSLKQGGIPDNSALNIWMEMDDNGLARRRNPDGSITNTTIVRSFTVQMRNM